jgi:hypothetical protein
MVCSIEQLHTNSAHMTIGVNMMDSMSRPFNNRVSTLSLFS